MTTPVLKLLCAGAAQGLVRALQAGYAERTGATIDARFGAVGAMKEALLGGAPCDLLVVTDKMVGELAADGVLRGGSRRSLGRVRTGVAVRGGDARPDVSTADGLRAALLAADAVYFPDPERATAGIHFARVMRELGVHETLAPRFSTHPNGATAMRELAASTAQRPIGCTQVTEIHYSDGVDLVGPLPTRFELATVYSAAVTTQAANPELAEALLELLCGSAAAALRQSGGFEG